MTRIVSALFLGLLVITLPLSGCLDNEDDDDEFYLGELIFETNAANLPTIKFIDYFGSDAFLIENSEVSSEIGIYTTDGTTSGTQLTWSPPNNVEFYYISEIGNSFLFRLNDELWKSDGTTAGTVQVFDFSMYGGVGFFEWSLDFIGIQVFIEYPSFSQTGQAELWVSDGTNAGTTQIYQFQDFGGQPIVFENDLIYFPANDSQSGMELWKSDGTTAGTLIHYESNLGSDGAFFSFLGMVGDRILWQQAHINATIPQLMSSETDGSNVELLAEIEQNYGDTFRLTQIALYYMDTSNPNSVGIYSTDGTISGTALLNQGVLSEEDWIGWVWEFDGSLLVSVYTYQEFDRIYTIDSSGTMSQFGDYILPEVYHQVGDEIFFTAGNHGEDLCQVETLSASFCGGTLFRTDGTISNTEPFLETGNWGDINPLHDSKGLLFYTRDSNGLFTTEI
tara:strand:+ start:371 stop:1717 length:1347 start_codon:yes stop_codon:yes gene_type:complete